MGAPKVKVPKPTAAEQQLQAAQAKNLELQTQILQQQQMQQKVLLPFFAEQQGFDVVTDSNGNITSIKKRADATQDLQKQLEKEMAERSLKALRGELPVSPALEKELKNQETKTRGELSARFGPGYETSTAGIQTLGELFTNSEVLREGARTAQLTLSEQLGLARQQQNEFSSNTSQDFVRQIASGDPRNLAGAFGQVAQGYGAAQQPYLAQRQLQAQANAANASNRAGMFGAVLGAAGSIFSSPAGGAFLFSDERLKDKAEQIATHHTGIPIYTFEYDGEMRIGVFAGDVELVAPHLVGERWGWKTVNYEAL